MVRILSLAVVFLLSMGIQGARAQRGSSSAHVPASGTFRALVVFVRFQDDTSTSGCAPAWQQWRDPDALPAVAPDLLAETPTPPFPESSLTAYFFQQSQGRFILYGNVFPRVVVTNKPEAAYGIRDAGSTRGLGELSRELLEALDPEVDFRRYDANSDGYVDHVFFILRRNQQSISWSGYSILGKRNQPALVYDGMQFDPELSGSYSRYGWSGNILPQVNLIRLLAHEFGHDLWTPVLLGSSHIQPTRRTYDAPEGNPDRIGYALMVGAGGGTDIRGDHTISAWERDLLGWIECPPLTRDTTVVLEDLYTAHDCRTIAIPAAARVRARTLYLANRQRVGVFDRLRSNDCTTPANDHGLMDTGLLVTVVERQPNGRGRFAIVPADNTLELSIEAQAYDGDLFGPGSATQLTPWTRPTISGFASYPSGFTLSDAHWQALDRIRGAGDHAIALEYVADFRTQPTIREDSWVGPETAGLTIPGPVIVTNGSTLDIDLGAGAGLTLAERLRVQAGTAQIGGRGQTITLARGAEIGEAGQLIVRTGTTLQLGPGQLITLLHGGRLHLESGAVLVYEGLGRVRGR